MSEIKFPTEVIELPSKGLLYPADHPLAKGTVEMKYMTAREEDILTNPNYIEKGLVVEKLLQSLLVTKVDLNEFFTGDKNALMIAARILGYGKDYTFKYEGKPYTVDLSKLEPKPLDSNTFSERNRFKFTLPTSGNEIIFKLLNEKDEAKVDEEVTGLKKINKDSNPTITTRLKHMIVSVNGDEDKTNIKNFVDNFMLAADSRALRNYAIQINPDIEMKFTAVNDNGVEEDVDIPIGITFFYPDFE
jgi:hypothetical protein